MSKKELILQDIRVSLDEKDGSLKITSKDPQLKGSPFLLRLTTESPTSKTLYELMTKAGFIAEDTIPAHLEYDQQAIESFDNRTEPLSFTLGETFENQKIQLDLSRSAHAMIFGATGVGKSTIIRLLLTQILNRPRTQLTIFDLTQVEYRDAPLRKEDILITEEEAIDSALVQIIDLIKERYRWMRYADVSDIRELADNPTYEFVVIDNLSTLFLSKSDKVNELRLECLTAIARLGPAAGVHLIMAAQKFSTGGNAEELMRHIGNRIVLPSGLSYDYLLQYLNSKPQYGLGYFSNRGRALLDTKSNQQVFQLGYTDPFEKSEK